MMSYRNILCSSILFSYLTHSPIYVVVEGGHHQTKIVWLIWQLISTWIRIIGIGDESILFRPIHLTTNCLDYLQVEIELDYFLIAYLPYAIKDGRSVIRRAGRGEEWF